MRWASARVSGLRPVTATAPFGNKFLRGSQPNAAGSAGNQGVFTC
jgi:hypothetical protein